MAACTRPDSIDPLWPAVPPQQIGPCPKKTSSATAAGSLKWVRQPAHDVGIGSIAARRWRQTGLLSWVTATPAAKAERTDIRVISGRAWA